jgi:deoxyribodipyrimidine photo-lyase
LKAEIRGDRDPQVTFFWFRRDLRLDDNTGLYHALRSGNPVQCVFIFDTGILDKLDDVQDARVLFIHRQLETLSRRLKDFGSSLITGYGKPLDVWKIWLGEYRIKDIFCNRDYEPYAIRRDTQVAEIAAKSGAIFHSFKDHVVFEQNEVVKDDGTPYTVFTPYKNRYLKQLSDSDLNNYETKSLTSRFRKCKPGPIHTLSEIGFTDFETGFPAIKIGSSFFSTYAAQRNYPAMNGTSRLSVHLRFGTISVRELMKSSIRQKSEAFTNELIWRDYYQMILWHFPHVANKAFKPAYDRIRWRNNPDEFDRWCSGTTGYPMVDAGMRELNSTGFMHNRVRMVTASFLVKHLLIDWRWGEAYFAKKLLDFDLASNNGGWQWAAGSGCDAAPYFRIFNPAEQARKFDPREKYIREWIPEYGTEKYPSPVVEHRFARDRCLKVFQEALKG